jgi:LPXTG-motif cell wall-anchored protein
VGGVVVILVGALWVGQGLGYLPGSFMTGDRTWFWIGLACVLAGLALLFASRRRVPEQGDTTSP